MVSVGQLSSFDSHPNPNISPFSTESISSVYIHLPLSPSHFEKLRFSTIHKDHLTYERLDASKFEIRLLNVHVDEDGGVECELTRHTLNLELQYYAL
jgi:hypothetical protein